MSETEIDLLKNAVQSVRSYETAGCAAFRRATDQNLAFDRGIGGAQQEFGGSRQITALHIPGDFVDLHSFLAHTMDHNVVAAIFRRFVLLPHVFLNRLTREHQHLARLFWVAAI